MSENIPKSVPRSYLNDAHRWTTIHVLQKQLSIAHIQSDNNLVSVGW